MSRYFIGIDVSTTASKALVIDRDGTVVASQSNPHDLSTPRPLWSEQDPENWWEATSKSLRTVMQQVSPDDIAAIGLTGQMHGLTPLDASGKPIRPAILWNDQRSGQQVAEMTEKVGYKRMVQIMGSRLLPGFTAPKMVWMRQNEPENYKQIAHVLIPKDYIRYRLSGAFIADVTEASGFGTMDLGKRTYSDELLAAWDLPRSWFPELCESPDVCTTVSAEAAAETGLRAGTPIVGGAGDQPAAADGMGVVHEGMLSLAIGTSGVAHAPTYSYTPEPDGRLHLFCGAVPGSWLYLGVMLSAAGSLRWLHDELCTGMSYDEINQRASSVPAGSLGLVFAPYLTGERTYLTGERNPHPDPYARGAFVGLTLRHGLSHFIRSTMEASSAAPWKVLPLVCVIRSNCCATSASARRKRSSPAARPTAPSGCNSRPTSWVCPSIPSTPMKVPLLGPRSWPPSVPEPTRMSPRPVRRWCVRWIPSIPRLP